MDSFCCFGLLQVVFVATARSYWICLWILGVLKLRSYEACFILSNYARLPKFHQLLWVNIWSVIWNSVCHCLDILGNGCSKVQQEEDFSVRLYRVEFDLVPYRSRQFPAISSCHEIHVWAFLSSLSSLLNVYSSRLLST